MNRLLKKEVFIIIDIILVIILIYMIFIILNSILTKDYIGPKKLDKISYFKVKLSNI